MPPKRHRLPQTFPHKIVFIISLVLCLCACGSIVNAVIAWSNYLWGYYIGTGFWSGAVILLAGMFGIVASYVRSICAVKTFMIISIFGCVASLGMIALASGGLDSESGFYSGYNKTLFMTHVVHAVYLGLGVLQLALGVLSDGICIYYLFIGRSAEIYCVKNDEKRKRKKKRENIRREGKDRSSTGSQVPLVGETKQSKRKSKDKDISNNQRGSESIDENTDVNEIFPIPYTATGTLDRPALLRQEALMASVSPIRNPYNRSSSFSTFGRVGGPDRESLVVHPTDDNASVADTVTTKVPQSPDDECHYAQTMLFGPPVPIEQDEVLPPYEVIDSNLLRKKPKRRGLKRPKSEEVHVAGRQSRGRNSVPEQDKRNSSKRSRTSQERSKVPPGRKEYPTEHGSLKKHSSKQSSGENAVFRLSKSADLLTFDDETKDKKSPQSNSGLHEQGVACHDFAHSSDMILVMDQSVRLRHRRPQSQTMKINRDRRLERRRKALSAEVQLNKDQERTGLEHRSDSIDGSNSSLFASNRIMPTKFSLRQPVRQIGMPHVCSPVPVKPLVSVPRVSPPPKPPRNYSVTAEDLNYDEIDMDEEVDTIFADIDGLNNNDDVFALKETSVSTNVIEEKPLLCTERKPSKVAEIQVSQVQKQNTFLRSDDDVTIDTARVPLSPEVKLDSGPVLKFIPPKRESKPPIDNVDGTANKETIKSGIISVDKSKEVHPKRQSADTMVLPSSPIMRPPPIAFLRTNKIDDQVQNENLAENRAKDNDVKTQSNFQFGNTNNKNTEIVYAKVLKGSPNSPASPTSPTSPTAKVLKAKRLTYTFKDRDVSVFDPIGNSKEIEETIEATESISVQFPVDKPKETEVVKKNEHPVAEKHNSNIESRPNGIVRQPPLSPSERILQRKANMTEVQKDLSPSKEDRPVIIQPANTSKDFDKNVHGARPKTSYKGLFAPLVAPKQSHGSKTDTKQFKAEKPVSNNVTSGSGNSADSQQKNIIQQPSRISGKSTSLPPTLPKPPRTKTNVNTTDINRITSSVPNSSVQFVSPVISTTTATIPTSGAAARDVPVNRVQGISVSQPMSPNSQGVLHLPQSQYSRQVSGTVSPPVAAANNPHVAGAAPNINIRQQNNAQQNNDNQPNKPLFSVVL
ncbi:uncharacterized protein LOC123563213 [Mercenaria mercenaria]|uniref:uncharacterized protein LOC123563213 n=1 Tax=Mercenaria mercenaria TaxID=6596 RepID=UPI00234E7976|nr:uncharacterized protein LOC123563213 [Mercenaria mercenaria]XP_045211823.2 uncharacterized protein LOC123563213 [Mercenaria mercenaria]